MKKDDARELVSLLSHRSVGTGQASVLVGPVDEIASATSDVLLKVIEDFNPAGTRPFLWAWDLGGVSPTLRSRCVLRFCAGTDTRTEGHTTLAMAVLKAYMHGDWVTLIEEIKGQENFDLLLRSVTDLLAQKLTATAPDLRYQNLWEVLRGLFGAGNLTMARVVSAFLQADHRSQEAVS